jgi:phosphatidylethanolamine-binding protein (PEBP) family uncharacterized protein
MDSASAAGAARILPPATRYFFRLYALPKPLSLRRHATADDVHAAVDRAQLASGTLVGLYAR